MIIKNLLAGLVCFIAAHVYAGTTEGKVGLVFIDVFDDKIKFSMEVTSGANDLCATQKLYYVSTSSQQGKNVLSVILAAKLSGQKIQAVGSSACADGAEGLIYIAVF